MRKQGIYVLIDKPVLEKIKDDPFTRRHGKSAFVREAVDNYMERKEESAKERKNDTGETK